MDVKKYLSPEREEALPGQECPVALNADWTKLFKADVQLAASTSDLIQFGRQSNWFFFVMAEKGVIDKPIFTGDWFYLPDHLDSTTLPDDGQERLDAVVSNFPIAQVIIGHEVKVAEEETKREFKMPDIPWGGIAKVALGVTVGAGLLLGYAALTAVSAVAMIDPRVIVCLAEPGLPPTEYPWILLFSYEE